jgi:DegV family protein with EDD domain
MTIQIVTDSTCDLPPHIVEQYAITVVPLHVNIGDRTFLDGVEISRETFYTNLHDYTPPPQTSAAAPGVFTETYEQVLAAGASAILSIHVADGLSATVNAAQVGADALPDADIVIFDSESVSMGLGLLVLSAAEMVANGLPMSQIVAELTERRARTYVFAAFDTLEYLRRGGRVNFAQAGLGALLRLKPILKVYGGAVISADRVRTWKRVPGQLMTILDKLGPIEKLAVVHTHAQERADELIELLDAYFPADSDRICAYVGPAIGTHAGPGAVGFACITLG